MNWFTRFLGMEHPPARNPADDFWFVPLEGGGHTESGVFVTDTVALQLPIVMDCLKKLSEPVASLPLKVFRKLPDGAREEAAEHHLNALLGNRPNLEQTAWEWRGQMQWWLGWYRNAYAEILPGPSGAVDQLKPHHPTLVRPYRNRSTREIWYEVRDRFGGPTRHLHASEILHLKALPFTDDGLAGRPVLETNGEVIGAALAVHRYGSRFFKNDGQAGGVLKIPKGAFKTSEDRDNYIAAVRRARTGQKAHQLIPLEHDIEIVFPTLDNQKYQFLETREKAALEVSRIWGIPPHMVGLLDRATHSNIEHQRIEFVSDVLLAVLEMWEQKFNTELVLEPDLYFVEFNVAGLLRGDLKSRYEAYFQARQGGWLSVNDIRRMENMNPVAGGDQHLQPLNMGPLGSPPPQRGARVAHPGDLGLSLNVTN